MRFQWPQCNHIFEIWNSNYRSRSKVVISLLALWANESSTFTWVTTRIFMIDVIFVSRHVRHLSWTNIHNVIYMCIVILLRYNVRTINWKKFRKHLLELWTFPNAAVLSITKPYNHVLRTKRAQVKLVIWWMESLQTLNRWCPDMYVGWYCKDNAVFQKNLLTICFTFQYKQFNISGVWI